MAYWCMVVQIPKLDEVYASYCANQVFAKSVLDMKKQDAHIDDFLERCLESPFSRHLDLWNFLGNFFTACCTGIMVSIFCACVCLQCFDALGWEAGRTFGL